MAMKHASLMVALVLGAAAAAGCWNEYCTELVIGYEGSRTGKLIARYQGEPGNMGSFQVQNIEGPFVMGRGTHGCASPALDSDQQWEAVAWLDVDGDTPDCASPGSVTDASCQPEDGEPQARSTFTQRACGLTRVELVLADP